MDEPIRPLKPGALRFQSDGQWVVANPGDPLYSTISLVAMEFFSDGEWQSIEPPTEESLK